MLIEFAITNFRSFRERQVFSLLPSGKVKGRAIMPFKVEQYPKVQVLPTAVLYGPNNAGKSNFVRAVRALHWLVVNSGSFNSDKRLDANEFFWFDKQTKNRPTKFEIDFVAANKERYIYTVSFDSMAVLEEELYAYNISKGGKTTINTLYKREKQSIKFTALKGVREGVFFGANQLFLSRGDIEGNQELKEVYSFFAKHLYVHQLTEIEYTNFLTRKYAEFTAKNKASKISGLIDKILRETDTGILGIETDLVDASKIPFPDDFPQEIKDKIFEKMVYEIRTRHKLFDGEDEIGEDTLPLQEQSTGTRKLLGLIPILLSALMDGDVLIMDEMNTSLHTDMATWIIDLFNNPATNPKQAQLIITTHDITLLDKELYEKDQVFIVEKSKFGTSLMYSFADFNWSELQTSRHNSPRLLDFYETGRLGGVPRIAKPFLEHLISQFLENGKAEEQ